MTTEEQRKVAFEKWFFKHREDCWNQNILLDTNDANSMWMGWNAAYEASAASREVESFQKLINDAITEAEKAMRKYPQPNYVITKLAEEAGEVVKAAVHCAEGRETYHNVRAEMKQMIAMAYRLWVEGDQVHGLRSVNEALAAYRKHKETM